MYLSFFDIFIHKYMWVHFMLGNVPPLLWMGKHHNKANNKNSAQKKVWHFCVTNNFSYLLLSYTNESTQNSSNLLNGLKDY